MSFDFDRASRLTPPYRVNMGALGKYQDALASCVAFNGDSRVTLVWDGPEKEIPFHAISFFFEDDFEFTTDELRAFQNVINIADDISIGVSGDGKRAEITVGVRIYEPSEK